MFEPLPLKNVFLATVSTLYFFCVHLKDVWSAGVVGAEKEYGKRNAVPKLNTQALELRVISALKFYSFLSIFTKF